MSASKLTEIKISTSGEGFYSINDEVEKHIASDAQGVLFLFCQHTSCALAINESFDPSAKSDMEEFLKHLAPRDLPFIQHTAEGPDDSPSHMKALLCQNHLALPIENGKIVKGTWAGIFLAEFRDAPHQRKILLRLMT